MKIKRTVYHKEGYKKIGQKVEIELTVDEMKEAHDEYKRYWKGIGGISNENILDKGH